MFNPKNIKEAAEIEKRVKFWSSFSAVIVGITALSIWFSSLGLFATAFGADTPRYVDSDTPEAQYIDTPSQNIFCTLGDDSVGCSIVNRQYSANDLDDCDSGVFSLTLDGKSSQTTITCEDNYVGSPDTVRHHLNYGDSVQWGDFACTSEESGLSCWQQSTGKGFILNRHKYAFSPEWDD